MDKYVILGGGEWRKNKKGWRTLRTGLQIGIVRQQRKNISHIE